MMVNVKSIKPCIGCCTTGWEGPLASLQENYQIIWIISVISSIGIIIFNFIILILFNHIISSFPSSNSTCHSPHHHHDSYFHHHNHLHHHNHNPDLICTQSSSLPLLSSPRTLLTCVLMVMMIVMLMTLSSSFFMVASSPDFIPFLQIYLFLSPMCKSAELSLWKPIQVHTHSEPVSSDNEN